jgi:hypothetical protein
MRNLKYRSAYYRRVTAAKITMYHGTCTGSGDGVLRSILKEGLKPDPKEKAYKSPYAEDDDYADGLEFNTEVTMRLDEALGGAYLTNDVTLARKYASHACGEHGGRPMLVSAQIETRSPEVKIDEDSFINYVWGFVEAKFKPESDETYYLDLYDWITEGDADWAALAKSWVEKQFPQAKISDLRWQQILSALASVLQDVMIITFLQEHEDEANREAYNTDRDWEVDAFYEVQNSLDSYKTNLAFVTDHLKEVTEPPKSGQHSIRILRPVGYRGANRILAVISWDVERYYATPRPGEYTQQGIVHYARTPQDAQGLLDASGVIAKYSKWTDSRGHVYYDNPAPAGQLEMKFGSIPTSSAFAKRDIIKFRGTYYVRADEEKPVESDHADYNRYGNL